MIGVKKIPVDRPKYVNRRMYDAQRRAWRKILANRNTDESKLVDIRELSKILKMSKGAIYKMIACNEFPNGEFRKGTKNAWSKVFVENWLKLGSE